MISRLAAGGQRGCTSIQVETADYIVKRDWRAQRPNAQCFERSLSCSISNGGINR